MEETFLHIDNRGAFRNWLKENGDTKKEFWIEVKRGKPMDDAHFWYLDAVEEALCFGWIDSIQKVVDGRCLQRFTARKKNSPWTELNKERVRRLENLGLMTESGRRVLPSMGPRSFKIDLDIEIALKKARVWTKFKSFPSLYQRVRAYNIAFYKKKDYEAYDRLLERLIKETKQGRMYREWNDYGRLLDVSIKNF